jgi:hypothetical protein
MMDINRVINNLENAGVAIEYELANKEAIEAINYLRQQLAKPAVEGVSDEVTKFAIDVEKMLCAKLNKTWQPSGMSIESLLDEIAPPIRVQSIKSMYTL